MADVLMPEVPVECLKMIVKHMGVETQCKMLRIDERFRELVTAAWRRTYNVFVYSQDSWPNAWYETLDLYKEVMNAIQPTLSKFVVTSQSLKHLRALDSMVFPKVLTVSADFKLDPLREHYTDRDTHQLAKMFPNARTVELKVYNTAKFLWGFRSLECLHLDTCIGLRTSYLKIVFMRCPLRELRVMLYGSKTRTPFKLSGIYKCHMLETISADDQHLIPVLRHMILLPRMKKLTCYFKSPLEVLLRPLVNRIGARVLSLHINRLNLSRKVMACIRRMPNLNKLALDGDYSRAQLMALADALPGLRELHLSYLREPGERDIADVVRSCPQLQVLSLENCSNITNALLGMVKRVLQERAENTQTFRLHCCETGVTGVDLASYNDDLMIADHIRPDAEMPVKSCCTVQWTPLFRDMNQP